MTRRKAAETIVDTTQSIFAAFSLDSMEKLTTTQARFCKVFINKQKENLTQNQSLEIFKQSLEEVLGNLIVRVEEGSNQAAILGQLKHDLENQSIWNVFDKYYRSKTVQKGTILDELAPYLNNEEKIRNFVQHEVQLLPSQLLSDLEPKAVNRDNLMNLLINLKREKSSDFKCFVTDYCDLDTVMHALSENKDSRIHLLVRTDVHYTTIIIDKVDGVNQAIVMDAAADPKCSQMAEDMKKHGFEKVYVLGLKDRIQFDFYNCAFFSLDSAWQSHKEEDLFKLLSDLPADTQNDLICLEWKNMPAKFVRNATSTTFVSNCLAKTQIYKNGETFKSYMDNHLQEIDSENGKRKMHAVLETKKAKNADKIRQQVEKCSPEDLSSLIQQNSLGNYLAN